MPVIQPLADASNYSVHPVFFWSLYDGIIGKAKGNLEWKIALKTVAIVTKLVNLSTLQLSGILLCPDDTHMTLMPF